MGDSINPFSLKLAVQQYDWGIKGEDSLVARLALAGDHIESINPTSPYAELWLGAHPNGPSTVLPLNEPLSVHLSSLDLPQVPFLFKVLSVGQALSIQSHPNASLARQLHRARPDLYKDPNPKPEMAVALTPFKALLGFRKWSEIYSSLTKFPLLAQCIGATEEISDHTRECYEKLMRLDSGTVQKMIDHVLAISGTSAEDFLIRELNTTYPGGDVGVLSVFFLNLQEFAPGEAVFIPADTPHAYLCGEILECMQNSDNVIRGGLTPKFKDVDVLIDSLSYEAFQGGRVKAEVSKAGWKEWRPLEIFGVTQVDCAGTWKSETTAIGIIVKGSAKISGFHRSFGWAGVFLGNNESEISECSPDFALYVADSTRL